MLRDTQSTIHSCANIHLKKDVKCDTMVITLNSKIVYLPGNLVICFRTTFVELTEAVLIRLLKDYLLKEGFV